MKGGTITLFSQIWNRLPHCLTLRMTALLVAFLAVPMPLQSSPLMRTHQRWRSSQADKIREAVYDYQIQECEPRNPQPIKFYKFYFLAVKHTTDIDPAVESAPRVDPDAAVMKHFRGHSLPVEGVSSSEGTNPPMKKHTFEEGVLLETSDIHWVSGSKVELSGATIYSEMGGEGGIYHVRFTKGNWVVSKFVFKWIS